MAKLLTLLLMILGVAWSVQAADPAKIAKAPERVPAGQLKRTKLVNAAYPEFARKNGMEGYVVLNFTVTSEGTTADIEVVKSDPVGIFDESAVRALSQWRYSPVERDGRAVAQPSQIKMSFVLPQPLEPPVFDRETLFDRYMQRQ